MRGAEGETRIYLCGRTAVTLAGRDVTLPGGRATELFAYLVLHRDRPSTRDELIDALWPAEPPRDAGAALSPLLSRLRRALGADAIAGRSVHRLILPPGASVDVDVAAEALERATAALAHSRFRPAWGPASLALSILDRPLLPGCDAPWIQEPRRQLDELRLTALECIARVGLGLGGGELAAAERAARALIAAAPFRESGYGLLIEALAAGRNVAEALRTYDDLRVLLRDELGTAPSAELAERHRRLLADGEPEPDAVEPEPVAPAPLAPPARARPATAFVGRATTLAALRAALDRARAGEPGLLFLTGEPGIGKTRLAGEFAREAHDGGASVLYGRCDEEAVVPYQPFVEALTGYVGQREEAALRGEIRRSGTELGRLVPELHRRLPDLGETPGGDPETERFRLFESVAALLATIARHAPLVLVLDDLHWADRPTLLLLRHVARAPHAPLLVLGAYRETELHVGHPLLGALADLRRERGFERLALSGLEEDEVADLIAQRAGREPPPALARAVRRDTEGNALFVEEVVRHLLETGTLRPDVRIEEMAIPQGITDAIERRLAGLSEPARSTLRLASAIGREFSLEVLEEVGEARGETLLAALEEAAHAGLIVEAGSERKPPARGEAQPPSARAWRADFSFSHALVRETLYRGLLGARRARLHGDIAVALERLHAADLEPRLAELAHHFSSAGAGAKAIEYERRAGARATELLAYEEAAGHYGRALRAMERGPAPPDEEDRCDLRLALGAAHWSAGEFDQAKETFASAAEAARRINSPDRIARAALGYGGRLGFAVGMGDDRLIALLRSALDALPAGDSVERAQLLARLAEAVAYSPEHDQRLGLCRDALAMARRIGDPGLEAAVLSSAHMAICPPANVDERLARASEILRLADLAGDRMLALEGHFWRLMDVLELGDFTAVETEAGICRRLAREARHQYPLWAIAEFDAMRALFEGRFAEAERLIGEALEIGGQNPNAMQAFGVQLFTLRQHQGRLEELEASTRSFVEMYPAIPGWRCALAFLYAELGRAADARRELDLLARDRFAALPGDMFWLTSATLLAGTCGTLGAAEHAATLHELMAPYAERTVVNGGWMVCLGSASAPLGLLAATAGRLDEAKRHFEDALEANARLGSPLWVAHARLEYADALARAGDRGAATALAGEARSVAEELGATRLVTWADDLRAGDSSPARPLRRGAGRPSEPGPRAGERALDLLTRGGRAALARLVRDASDAEIERRFGTPRAQKAIFTALARAFRPARAFGFQGTIAYELTRGRPPGDPPVERWTITVAGGAARASRGGTPAPALTLRVGIADFVRVLAGELDPAVAMLEGRAEAHGDLPLAARLSDMFGA